MVEEPDELYGLLDDYNDRLLGAVLVRPTEIYGPECARLDLSDVRSDVLARTIEAYRRNPAVQTDELVRLIVRSREDVYEIVRAMEAGIAWNAQFYARQIRRLEGSRRKFREARRKAAKYWEEMSREM